MILLCATRRYADESVTLASNRFYESGIARAISQGGAYCMDALVEAMIKVAECGGWPKLLFQLQSSSDLAGSFEQKRKRLIGLRLKTHSHAMFSQFACGRLKFKSAKMKWVGRYMHNPDPFRRPVP
jgi:hypothetical protein